MIPRLIHQIYLTGDLPGRLAEHVADLQARQPGWTHRLYSSADAPGFILRHFGQDMLATYERINPDYGAARADLLRQLIMFVEGGVYLDIKSDLLKPLDEVIRPDDQYVLTQWRNGPGEPHQGFGLHPDVAHIPGGEYPNHHLIGVPGHPFTRAAIDRIVNNIRHYRPWSGVGKMGVVRTTGPVAYTLAVHPLLGSAPHRFSSEEELGILFSIPDYSHRAVFTRHYSTLTGPVVRLSAPERLAQRGVEWLRRLKQGHAGKRRA
jgi:mannosyltransferase OCH1-like enzyme